MCQGLWYDFRYGPVCISEKIRDLMEYTLDRPLICLHLKQAFFRTILKKSFGH
jgi:hypothetical protein